MQKNTSYKFEQIGIIKTPYQNNAPYQPIDTDKGEFYIIINDQYVDGLSELGKFHYIYVIYYVDRITRKLEMMVSPPWAKGKKVGVFASRSPVRPNTIGLSIVRLKGIVENKIYTSGLDAFDGTPLLDIKPYVPQFDEREHVRIGWLENKISKLPKSRDDGRFA